MAADGYIRIDTKIDQAGAQTGLASLTKSLKGFAAMAATAFAVTAVVSFSKSCISLASDLNEVKNVVDTTFGSAARKIYDFADIASTQFGLSKLSAEQYTGTMGAMLKSMGFATDAAADMSISMAGLAGDMASFYNLSTDEAFAKIRAGISGETEPLKQLGVNLSEATLTAYALAEGMGTAYNKMTEQNKALVRYNYLMSATADAQGDFAKTLGTSWANQVRVMEMNWASLKTTLGGTFITVLTPVLKMVNNIISSLNAAATVFASFMSAVTGTAQTATTAVAGATTATEDLTAATDASADSSAAAGDAAKKAGKSLASFDDLNVLSDPGSATVPGATPAADTTTTTTATQAGEAVNKSMDDMKAKLAAFFSKYQEEIGKVRAQWETLKTTVTGIFDKLRAQFASVDIGGAAFQAVLGFLYAIETAANLVIGVVGNLFIAFNVPEIVASALGAISAAFQALGDIIAAITPGVLNFVNTALVPIAEWIGGKVVDAFNFLAEQLTKIGDWFMANQENFAVLGQKLGEVVAVIWKLVEPIADAAWSVFKTLIGAIVDTFLALGGWILKHPNLIVDFLAVFGTFKAAAFVLEMLKVIEAVYKLVKAVGIWDGICFAAAILMDSLKVKTMLVYGAIALLIIIIAEIAQNWSKMNGAQKVISILGALAVAAAIAAAAVGALQSALTLGIAAIAIAGGVAAIALSIKAAQSNAASSASAIPHLAQGAVIPPNREFMATLGDQKRGINIEAPLDTIKQGVAEVLAGMDLGGGGGGSTTINFSGSLSQLARVLQPTITREDARRGPSLVKGGS